MEFYETIHFYSSSAVWNIALLESCVMPVLQSGVTWTGYLCASSRWLFTFPSGPLWTHFIAEMAEYSFIWFPAVGLSRQREKRSYGSQPPKWPPNTLACQISCTCVVPSDSEQDWQGWMIEHDSWSQVTKDIETSDLLSLGSLALGEARCHAVRMLKQHYGEAHTMRNSSLQPIARTDWPATWGHHLGSLSSSPSLAFRWDCKVQPYPSQTM